jgi:hypothetical protein
MVRGPWALLRDGTYATYRTYMSQDLFELSPISPMGPIHEQSLARPIRAYTLLRSQYFPELIQTDLGPTLEQLAFSL